MANRMLSGAVVVAGLVFGGALAACVGDAPEASSADDAGVPALPATDAPGPATPPSSPGHDAGSSSNPTRDAAADADSSAPIDASMLPDTSTPLVCSEPAIPMGAYNFRCSASAAALVNPGGTVLTGTYLLTRYWGGTTCGPFEIGWADIFEQDGATYLRYERLERAMASDPGTKHIGTMLLAANAGRVDLTEKCDAATLGAVTSGAYEATNVAGTAPTLKLSFTDHQEQWTKQ